MTLCAENAQVPHREPRRPILIVSPNLLVLEVPNHAPVNFFAARFQDFDYFYSSISCDTFFIAGNQQCYRAVNIAGITTESLTCCYERSYA